MEDSGLRFLIAKWVFSVDCFFIIAFSTKLIVIRFGNIWARLSNSYRTIFGASQFIVIAFFNSEHTYSQSSSYA